MTMKRLIALLTLLTLLLSALCAAQADALPIDFSAGMKPNNQSTEKNVYEDPTIRVEWHRVANSETKEFNCSYCYAYITISDASQLRTSSLKGFDRVSVVERVEVMARHANAVLAINGDFYSARIGKTYLLRQGVLYYTDVGANTDVLLIDEYGDFHLVTADQDPASMDLTQWEGRKIINAFNFGPALVENNVKVLNPDHVPYMSAPEGRGQRMCIAQTGPLQYLVLSCDNSAGMTMDELCDCLMMLSDNVIAAYNLDGGNSAQMVYLGKKINRTKDDVNTRKVSDIIYFASAYVPEEGK